MTVAQCLRRCVAFEIKSLLGRIFLVRYPKSDDDQKFLNLGCGGFRPEGWVNADFFCFRKRDRPDWMLDLRYPLPCHDNYWDGIFSEHTLEHLSPQQAEALLQELYRVLKPGRWIRLSVPDLERYIAFYTGRVVDDAFAKQWAYPGDAIHRLTQEFGHVSVWDAALLQRALDAAGFGRIQQTSYQHGTDRRLCIEQQQRHYESLYMDAQKPEA
jgi:predicted SAM-dependent methyltransferase